MLRYEKIDELFNAILEHICGLVRTSEASFLEIAVAEAYASKALLRIVAMTSGDKTVETVNSVLEEHLDNAAIQEIIGFIKERTKGEENVEHSENK